MPYNPGEESELSPRDATESFEHEKLTPAVSQLYAALAAFDPLAHECMTVGIHQSIVDDMGIHEPENFDPEWLSPEARAAWDQMKRIESAWDKRADSRRARLSAETADIATTLMARG